MKVNCAFIRNLRRPNFAASALYKVNPFDSKIRYQVLQAGKKRKKNLRGRATKVRNLAKDVPYIYMYIYVTLFYSKRRIFSFNVADFFSFLLAYRT